MRSAGAELTEMTAPFSGVRQGLKLRFADGQQWVIRPVDEEAAVIVAELGRVMRLGPGEGGRELCVAVGRESDRAYLETGT